MAQCARIWLERHMSNKPCEDLARETYVKQTNTVCQRAGLFLHKDYPFLAGSPDGLLENNGLLEIKSPYNARNCDPNSYHFEFLNKSDYSIKMNHHYYYQGLLEITDRSWSIKMNHHYYYQGLLEITDRSWESRQYI
ncbi:YqaJ-like viral recombinase domain [Popillia japonica]|uniref:YqaJ-like viral recombinase domain n=1 Tax=Popillia japonica TaxID=7064 RepID=A0AAW1JV55_POPJA